MGEAMNIGEMPAGREIDVLIAEKVFGYDMASTERHSGKDCRKCFGSREDGYYGWVDHKIEPLEYSDDIAAAWGVVEKLIEIAQAVDVWWDDAYPKEWEAECITKDDSHYAQAETAPLAICRLALKAVDVSSA
jgi:hypothetical protein